MRTSHWNPRHLLACNVLLWPVPQLRQSRTHLWDEGSRPSTKLRVVVTAVIIMRRPNVTTDGHVLVRSLISLSIRETEMPSHCLPMPSPEHGWIKKGLHGGVRYYSVRNSAWTLVVWACYSSELRERPSTPPRAGHILSASMRERSMRGDTGIMGCSYEMRGSSCWQNIDQRWARGTGLPTANAASTEGCWVAADPKVRLKRYDW